MKMIIIGIDLEGKGFTELQNSPVLAAIISGTSLG
jgi:hypothetical protein